MIQIYSNRLGDFSLYLMHGPMGQEFVIFSNIEVIKYCWLLDTVTKFTILKSSGLSVTPRMLLSLIYKQTCKL